MAHFFVYVYILMSHIKNFTKTKKPIIMSTTHSLSNKKRKVSNPPVIISFKDTYLNLYLQLRLTYRKCIVKNEIATCIIRKGCQ